VRSLIIVSILLLWFSLSSMAQPGLYQLHWQHRFTPAQQQQLQHWLHFSATATTDVLGPYPFTMQLYLYQHPGNEPVPWANTWRESSQQIHFHVDPRFDQSQFKQDWTAYHEIAHLALPFLGTNNAWFAEGFASFMQYQIMQQAGLIDSAATAISAKFIRQRRHYLNNNSMRDNALAQLKARRFAAGYWGAAQFFVVADIVLQQQGKGRLTQLIQRYQRCCRLRDQTLNDVIVSFDRLTESNLFSELLQQFKQQPATEFMLRLV
jgi:hypothetical protein